MPFQKEVQPPLTIASNIICAFRIPNEIIIQHGLMGIYILKNRYFKTPFLHFMYNNPFSCLVYHTRHDKHLTNNKKQQISPTVSISPSHKYGHHNLQQGRKAEPCKRRTGDISPFQKACSFDIPLSRASLVACAAVERPNSTPPLPPGSTDAVKESIPDIAVLYNSTRGRFCVLFNSSTKRTPR